MSSDNTEKTAKYTAGFEQNFSPIYQFESLAINYSARSKSIILSTRLKCPPQISDDKKEQAMTMSVEQARLIIRELQKTVDYIDAGIDDENTRYRN